MGLRIPKARTDIASLGQRQTQFLLLGQMYGGKVPRAWAVLLAAGVLTAVGIYIAFHFFPEQAGVISVFFTVLGLLPTVDVLIERNKKVMDEVADFDFTRLKFHADARLAVSVLALFVAILLAYGMTALFLPMEKLQLAFQPQLAPWIDVAGPEYRLSALGAILMNNLSVSAGVLLLSIIYRTGGALLVLTWNASVWGTVFAYFARNQAGSGLEALGGFLTTMACIFPHIVLEAAGYIMMALGGVMIVRFLAHMSDEQVDLRRTAINAAGLCTIAVLIITIAGVVEVTLSPTLLQLVKNHS